MVRRSCLLLHHQSSAWMGLILAASSGRDLIHLIFCLSEDIEIIARKGSILFIKDEVRKIRQIGCGMREVNEYSVGLVRMLEQAHAGAEYVC
jgi:hypothetical protein